MPATTPDVDSIETPLPNEASPTEQLEDGPVVPAIVGLPPANDSDATYRIGSEDLLQIEVFRVEELATTERVNEQGFIIMPLIGAIQVGGLTSVEAERHIAESLRRYVRDPQVNLFIAEYASQNVTVAGAVEQSGVFPLKGRTTLLQVIAQAGGITDLAEEEEVVIFRTPSTGETQAYIVNLRQIQEGALNDPLLIGNDRVFVPESGTAGFIKGLTDTLRGFIRIPIF